MIPRVVSLYQLSPSYSDESQPITAMVIVAPWVSAVLEYILKLEASELRLDLGDKDFSCSKLSF